MSKKARSEGNRVAGLIKANKAEFYIADVDLGDNSSDVSLAVEVVKKTLGKTKAAFMLISAGIVCATVVSYVPLELEEKLNSEQWINESVKNISGKVDKKGFCSIITADTPFKLKDMIRSNGFSYLTKQGCMGDEESSEEFIGFDDL